MRVLLYVGGPSTTTHCKSGAPQYMTGQPQRHGVLEWVKNDNTMYIGGHFICNEVLSVGLPFVPPCIDISSERTHKAKCRSALASLRLIFLYGSNGSFKHINGDDFGLHFSVIGWGIVWLLHLNGGQV